MNRINFIPDSYLNENLGLVNNNPGNIRFRSDIIWQGQAGEYAGFVKFVSLPYGYRALIKNLQFYITNYNKDTINTMISTWCPPGPGCDTPTYINHVEERSGINRNQKINANDIDSLAKIAGAISISEIGVKDGDALNQAVQLIKSGATIPFQPQNITPRSDFMAMIKPVAAVAGIITAGVLLMKYLSNDK